MKPIFKTLIIICLIFSSSFLYAQQKNGRVEGTVKDAASGEVLPYANVTIVGTTIGALSNDKGFYSLATKPGAYKMKVSYVSYNDTTVDVNIVAEKVIVKNIELVFESTMGEEVVITAQAYGQIKAINTQIASREIKNVVSEQKIRELPDANAAEALARLPGVSVNRDGGEATSVNIRGTGTNTIYVNGMRMYGGLASLSSSMIGSIELSKSFTADKDADVLGGSVEFKMRDAPSGFKKQIELSQGYDVFTKSFKNNMATLALSNRFFKDKLGVMLSFSYDRKDRSRDVIQAIGQGNVIGYETTRSAASSEDIPPVKILGMRLQRSENLNKRADVALYSDFRLKNGKIYYQGMFTNFNGENKSSTNTYAVSGLGYSSSYSNSVSNTIMNGVGGEHTVLGGVKIDWGVSLSQAKNNTPFAYGLSGGYSGGMTDFNTVSDTTTIPQFLALGKHDLAYTAAQQLSVTDDPSGSFTDELGYKLNIEVPYKIGNQIKGYVKFGGKLRDIDRGQDINTRYAYFNSVSQDRLDIDAERLLPDYGWTHTLTGVPDLGMEAFLGPQQTMDFSMLNTQLYYTPDFDKVKYIESVLDTFLYRHLPGDQSDYTNHEKNYAAYIMTGIDIGKMITFTPGVRYEKSTYSTTAKWGLEQANSGPYASQGILNDTTDGFHNERFFPMINLKIKPLKWFDIRMAYTQTVSRPGFTSMSPRFFIPASGAISRGNMTLKPQSNTNYDIYLSFYGKKLGLFSAGAFYKKMEDQVTGYSVTMLNAADYGLAPAYNGRQYSRPVNNKWPGYMKGVELDWQAQFAYLPKPFNGIILNANVTFMQSETKYPYYKSVVVDVRDANGKVIPPFKTEIGTENFRASSIIGVPDMVGNFVIGYETGGFSGRVSVYHQSTTLSSIQALNIAVTELNKVELTRVDLSLSQKIRKIEGLTLLLNINNLTNNPDKRVLAHHPDRTENDERYGASGDIGIRYRF